MSYEREPVEAQVADLKPRMKNLVITFKVLELGEEREVTSRDDGATHRVLDAIVGDATGTVAVPCWDNTIDMLEWERHSLSRMDTLVYSEVTCVSTLENMESSQKLSQPLKM